MFKKVLTFNSVRDLFIVFSLQILFQDSVFRPFFILILILIPYILGADTGVFHFLIRRFDAYLSWLYDRKHEVAEGDAIVVRYKWRRIGILRRRVEKQRHRARKVEEARIAGQEKMARLMKERDVVLSSPYQVTPDLYRKLFPQMLKRGIISHKKPREGTFLLFTHLIEGDIIFSYNDNQYMSDREINRRLEQTYIYQLRRFPKYQNALATYTEYGELREVHSFPYRMVHYLTDEQADIFIQHIAPKDNSSPTLFL